MIIWGVVLDNYTYFIKTNEIVFVLGKTKENSLRMSIVRNRKIYCITVAFLLPCALLAIIYALCGQYPFGDNSLLIWDMDWQYCSYFSHLHDILHRNASPVYSFSRAIGGDMLGVSAYYLISPFNLIFYFFDSENIYIGILILSFLKVGMSGTSMYLFLYKNKNCAGKIIFSTSYALSAYVVGYQFNIFWIDAVILLPIVVMGIEKLIEQKKYSLYIISLALSIITNFYTGYMICLFSVLYFGCYFFLCFDGKKRVRTVISYVFSSITGGLLSMFISLPTLYVLSGGKGEIKLAALKNFTKIFEIRKLFDACFTGMIDNNQITEGAPLLYCGIISIIVACYWLLFGKCSWRKRLCYLILICFMLSSFLFYNLNCLWHGMNLPTGSPFRNAYIYVFVILYMASMGFKSMEIEDGKKRLHVCIISIILFFTIILRSLFGDVSKQLEWNINIALILAYSCFIIINFKKYRKVIIFGIMCFELIFNATSLYTKSEQYKSVNIQEYHKYIEKINMIVEQVKKDDTFFRTVLAGNAYRTHNDPFMFNLYGLDSYTSVENEDTIKIAERFGLNNSISFGIHYKDGITNAGESLLGVKYLITSELEPGEGYYKIMQTDDVILYENLNVIPMFILANGTILENINTNGAFDYLNEFYHCLSNDISEDILIPAQLKYIGKKNCYLKEDGKYGCVTGINNGEEAYIEYVVYNENKKGDIYLEYKESGVKKVALQINDQVQYFGLSNDECIVKKVGKLGEGEKAIIRFILQEGDTFDPEKVYIYTEDMETLAKYKDNICAENIDITLNSDSDIEVTYINTSQSTRYLLCSIPYDEGWRVWVNGIRTENMSGQGFLAIPLQKGMNKIRLRYVPRGMNLGIVISIGTLLLLVCERLFKTRERKNVNTTF